MADRDGTHKPRRQSSSELSGTKVDHAEHHTHPSGERDFSKRPMPSNKAAHPLAGYSHEQLAQMGEKYARSNQHLTDEEEIRAFRIGAVIAGDMDVDDDLTSLRRKYEQVEGLTEEERTILVNEVEHKWKNPGMLYFLVTSEYPTICPIPTTPLTQLYSLLPLRCRPGHG